MSSKKFVDARKKIFGDRIRTIRQHLKIAQNIFAEELKTSAGYISEIESGKTNPGIDLMEALKNVYHVNINWLLTGIGGMFETSHISEYEGVAEQIGNYEPDIDQLLKAAEDILRSDNETVKSALKSNIIAFHYTVKCDKEIKILKRDVDAMKKILNPGAPNTKAKGD
jgi:transcriptional regulator with XRE-family HTH domain